MQSRSVAGAGGLDCAPMPQTPAAGWLQRYRSVLALRDLRLLLGALVVSATGSWAYNVALFAFVFDRTHSLGWVARPASSATCRRSCSDRTVA